MSGKLGASSRLSVEGVRERREKRGKEEERDKKKQ